MKLKIPRLLRLPRPKKLRAATARRSAGGSAEMDYGEMAEPNMKLSRALLIVLLLHVVAVAGIIAFNAIKTRKSSFAPAPLAANTENNLAAKSVGSANNSNDSNPKSAVVPRNSAVVPRNEVKTSRSLSKPIAKDEHPKSSEDEKAPASSEKVYTVVKGDNPVTIAKKLKVSYGDLIALNHIEDPRKLQIGQKLLIPKTTKPKKNEK
jgi:LysM repeat protein